MISRARVMGIQIVIVQRQPTTRAPLFVPTIDLSRPALAHDTIKERAASYSVGQSPLCGKRAKKAAVGWMGEGDDEHGKYSGVSPAKGLLLKEEDRPTDQARERERKQRLKKRVPLQFTFCFLTFDERSKVTVKIFDTDTQRERELEPIL